MRKVAVFIFFPRKHKIAASLLSDIYILFAIWARFMDKRDIKKMNVIAMKDNHYPIDGYFYELIVFTGNRSESGTQSKIKFQLNGELNETDVRMLNDNENKTVLQTSSVDSFIMAVQK